MAPSRRLTTPTLCLLAAVLVLTSAPVSAEEDCLTGGLGSTLLIPYFEVDVDAINGRTTTVAVTQETSAETMVRVVLWTDWGHPTLGFDVYLDGFDVQTFNVRDLLNGTLPATGVGVDLTEIQGCAEFSNTPASYSSTTLSASQAVSLQKAHTGQLRAVEGCSGQDYGDGIARGYVTIDVVSQCSGAHTSALFNANPARDGYFDTVALDSNILQGDWFLIDPSQNSAQGYRAVSIWSDPARFDGPDEYTFYGRYVDWDGSDHRVPLSSVWSARYFEGGSFDGGADFIVWRDTKAPADGFDLCGLGPSWRPLTEQFITGRSEETEPSFSSSGSTAFPLATQKVNASEFDPAFPFGRVQFGLNHGSSDDRAQAWVGWVGTGLGRYSVGMEAAPVIDNCEVDPTP